MSRFEKLEFNDREREIFASAASPSDEAKLVEQAEAAFEAGRFEKSLRVYSKILGISPRLCAAWAGQIRALIELEEISEAKLWAEKALEAGPNDGEIMAATAVALARRGDTEAALVFSDNAVEANAADPRTWISRGDVLLALKEKRADYSFEKAAALSPSSWKTRWLIARSYRHYHKMAKAISFAQQALGLSASEPMVWHELGSCQRELGLRQLAFRSLTEGRQLDPQNEHIEAALRILNDQGWFTRLFSLTKRLLPLS